MADRKIALCLVAAANDFQQLLKSDAEEAARRAGLGLDLYFTGHDLVAQLNQLRACVDSDPPPIAILALAVRDHGLARVVRDAARAGVSFVYLNRTEDLLDEVRRDFPGVAVCTVCAEELETGRIQGRQFRALLPGGRLVLYVQGSTRSLAARDRTAGMQEAVQGAPLEVSPIEGGWSTEAAREAVQNWLKIVARGNVRVDLVGCQNDQIALGAIEALAAVAADVKRPELARIPVTGCDGTPTVGQKLVRDGKLAATVILPRSAGPAVERIARMVHQKEMPPPLVTLTPSSYPAEGELKPLQARA